MVQSDNTERKLIRVEFKLAENEKPVGWYNLNIVQEIGDKVIADTHNFHDCALFTRKEILYNHDLPPIIIFNHLYPNDTPAKIQEKPKKRKEEIFMTETKEVKTQTAPTDEQATPKTTTPQKKESVYSIISKHKDKTKEEIKKIVKELRPDVSDVTINIQFNKVKKEK